MDEQVAQVLPTDERGTYEASLHCPHTQVTSLPCVITGKSPLTTTKGSTQCTVCLNLLCTVSGACEVYCEGEIFVRFTSDLGW